MLFRSQVLAGHVGFAAFDSRRGIIARTLAIPKSLGPQTIALRVPDIRPATHIVIFNESTVPSGGLVDVLDATVLAPKDSGPVAASGGTVRN